MANDDERLIVAVEARIRDFEKNMLKASRVGGQSFDQIERRAKQSGDRLEKTMGASAAKIGDMFKTFGGGLAGGIIGGLSVSGLTAIVGRMNDVAKATALIGNNAKRAGVDLKSFQELSFVAKQNRIDVDALTDGLKELNLRADEFVVTGKGGAAEAFQRLGFSASQLKEKLKDPSALLVEIMQRMEGLNKAAQIRIADELFGGTAGERFVELLDLGAAGIRKQIEEANRLGVVLDQDVISKADELSRRFDSIATTIETRMHRGMVLLATDLMDWIDSFKGAEEQSVRQLGDRLAELGKRRLELEKAIGEARGSGRNAGKVINTANLELKQIAEEEARIMEALGKRTDETASSAKEATPAINGLNSSLQSTGLATGAGASGLTSYADAMRALKNEIPELAEGLANLDARTRIDTAYKAALQNARSIGDTIEASRQRDAALSALASKGTRDAGSKGMLDLIGYAEGTDKGRGYNETLGFGKFTGGDKNLVLMTLDEVDAMQTGMLRHPDNKFNSSAAGRYQIVQKTLRGLRGKLGLKGDERFDAGMQDRLAQELLRQRGSNPAGLRNEWEGLRRVDDATIRKAYDGTSVSMPALDPAQAANAERAKEQAKTYAEIIAGAKEFTATQQLEQQALGMTAQRAAAFRYEQDMLNQAQQAGIQLSPQQRADIGQLANGMAVAEAQVKSYAETQAQAAEASRMFGGMAVDALSGLITGTMTAEQALQSMLQQLVRVGLQAMLLGEGPLAGLFGGASGGGLIGALFGFADGGYTGHGGKHDPAGVVHRGEVVWSQRDVARVGGPAAAEAIRTGRMPGYADGGIVGGSKHPLLPRADAAPEITISAPVTVNANGGTPAQNDDMAKRVAREMEATMRGVVASELQKQMRPGNMLNTRGR